MTPTPGYNIDNEVRDLLLRLYAVRPDDCATPIRIALARAYNAGFLTKVVETTPHDIVEAAAKAIFHECSERGMTHNEWSILFHEVQDNFRAFAVRAIAEYKRRTAEIPDAQ